MGWFTSFKRKNDSKLILTEQVPKAAPQVDQSQLNGSSVHDNQGVFLIYAFLQQNFGERGYNDALISADEGYKNDNIRLIKYDLEILIQQVKTYHQSLMKDMQFHIQSRTRAGLIDLVDELKIKQTDLQAHIEKVHEIEEALKTDYGLCERAILAYKRGFMKGMASITQTNLLTKKF